MFLNQIFIELIGTTSSFLENLVIVLLVQKLNLVYGIRVSFPQTQKPATAVWPGPPTLFHKFAD
jgi:hypothetical protein